MSRPGSTAGYVPTYPNEPKASTSQQSVGGVSRPGASGSTPPGGVSRPASAAPLPAVPQSSKLDATVQKKASAAVLGKLDAEQKKFTEPPKAFTDPKVVRSSPVWSAYGSRFQSTDDYYRRREEAMRRLHWDNPPVYVIHASPSYGFWSGAFLGAMLEHSADHSWSRWAYSHQADPGYLAWRADMDRQARDNDELRRKLADLDKQVAELKDQNAAVDQAALPDDVPAEAAIAPEAAVAATTPTGGGWGWTILWVVLIAGGTVAGTVLVLAHIGRRRRIIAKG